MRAADRVRLRRHGRTYDLALNITWEGRQPCHWRVGEPLREGEELLLPAAAQLQAVVGISVVVPPMLVGSRLFHWDPGPPIGLDFLGMVLCPNCDSYLMHPVVTVPEVRHFIRHPIYVLRTCALCGACWEQEAL